MWSAIALRRGPLVAIAADKLGGEVLGVVPRCRRFRRPAAVHRAADVTRGQTPQASSRVEAAVRASSSASAQLRGQCSAASQSDHLGDPGRAPLRDSCAYASRVSVGHAVPDVPRPLTRRTPAAPRMARLSGSEMQVPDRVRDPRRPPGRNVDSRAAVEHALGQSAHAGGHHRDAARHRLEWRPARRVHTRDSRQRHRPSAVAGGTTLERQGPAQLHPIGDAQIRRPGGAGTAGPQGRRRAGRAGRSAGGDHELDVWQRRDRFDDVDQWPCARPAG